MSVKKIKVLFDNDSIFFEKINDTIYLVDGSQFKDDLYERIESNDIPNYVFSLNDKKVIESILKIIKVDKFHFAYIAIGNAGKVLIEFSDEIKEIVQNNNMDFYYKFQLLYPLARYKGRESFEYMALNQLYYNNELAIEQRRDFEKLKLDFQIEEKYQSLIKDASGKGYEDFKQQLSDLKSNFDQRLKRSIETFDKAVKEQDILVTSERKEGLQKQVDQLNTNLNQGLNRTQTMTRNFLIVISVIFTILTGVLFGIVIHLWNLIIDLMSAT